MGSILLTSIQLPDNVAITHRNFHNEGLRLGAGAGTKTSSSDPISRSQYTAFKALDLIKTT
jgi:hypothetical protein